MGVTALGAQIGLNGPDQPYLGPPHTLTGWGLYLISALRLCLSHSEGVLVSGSVTAVSMFGYGCC